MHIHNSVSNEQILADGAPAFAHRGFYLHSCWKFDYPFAVRTWQHKDFTAMFRLLRHLGFDRVMLWPPSEMVPPPLAEDDAQELQKYRDIIGEAQSNGLECWITQTPNLTSNHEIARQPLHERHFYPFMHTVRVDNEPEYSGYLQHREELLRILNNADGYVTIDGDPGGYPGAKPDDFIKILECDRAIINRVGTHPGRQKIVPWLWCGWGHNWEGNGPWNEPIAPLVTPILQRLKQGMGEPWEILAGRSHREGWANGRIVIEATEKAELVERATLLFDEIIEFEPTPPAVVLQFDYIRDNIRREINHAATARGCFGNAQQPLMALPNLYFFARATADAAYLEKSDTEVLHDLAAFLDGPPELLCPAWECLRLELSQLPYDLPQQLRQAHLQSEAAHCLPGGPQRYLQILADLVAARLGVLRACPEKPVVSTDAATAISDAVRALVHWWQTHHYVYSGEQGTGFRWSFTHPALLAPLQTWIAQHVPEFERADIAREAATQLGAAQVLAPHHATSLLCEFLGVEE